MTHTNTKINVSVADRVAHSNLLRTRMSGRKKIRNDKDNNDYNYDNDSKYFSHDTCTQLQCQCGQFYDTIIIRQGYWYSSLFPSLYLCSLVRVYNVLFYNLLQERIEK